MITSIISQFIFLIQVSSSVCPAGIGASKGDQPKIRLAVTDKQALLFCGNAEENRDGLRPSKGVRILNEFNVWMVGYKKEPVSLLEVGANTHYLVSEQKNASGNVEVELKRAFYFGAEWTPISSFRIQCDSKDCVKTEEKCSLKKPAKPPYPRVIDQIQATVSAEKVPASAVPLDTLVYQAFQQALSGDPQARAYFETPPRGLDGAAAEEWEAGAEALKLAKPCL